MELAIGLLVILTFTIILVGVPIYISLVIVGVTSLAVLATSTATPLATIVVPQSIFSGMANLPLMAIPFFILAGELMNRAGITEKLIKFSLLLIGRISGGLAQATVVSSMLFSGVTGSATATSSAMGGIMIPAMKKGGYKTGEAAGLISTASTCGAVIPPSIIMVVYATSVGASVGAMFMGGIIPGILVGFALMLVVFIRSKIHNFPRRTETISRKEAAKIILDGIIPVGMMVVVVGGIMRGIFTPTEAGAIAVAYSLLVSLLVTRSLKVRALWPIFLETANRVGPLLLLIACARIFSFGLTALQMPAIVSDLILSATTNPLVFLLLINILLLAVGMFLDGGASVIILAPILAPVAMSMGISLIHFGVIMCLNLSIATGTPPVGYCLFITSKIGGIPVEGAIKGSLPYLLSSIFVLFLITYIPYLVTFIPTLLGLRV